MLNVLLAPGASDLGALRRALTDQGARVELVDDLAKGLRATATQFDVAVIDGATRSLTLNWAVGELQKRKPGVRLFTVGGAPRSDATHLAAVDAEPFARELTGVPARVPEVHDFTETSERWNLGPFFVVWAELDTQTRWLVGIEDEELFDLVETAAAALARVPETPALQTMTQASREGTCVWIAFEPLPPGLALAALSWTLRQDGKRLSSNTVAYLGLRACEGLALLHRARTRHGAVRPEAIWLPDDTEPMLRYAGIGVFLEADRARSRRGAGYRAAPRMDDLAPEQSSDPGGKADHRCDIYQLGYLLFEALTGAAPFAVFPFDRPIAPPSALVPDVPGLFSALVLLMLEREPEARPGVWQVQETLRACLWDTAAARDELATVKARRKVLNAP